MPVPLHSGQVTFISAPVGFINVDVVSLVFETSLFSFEIISIIFFFPVPLQSGQGVGLPPHVRHVFVTDSGLPWQCIHK